MGKGERVKERRRRRVKPFKCGHGHISTMLTRLPDHTHSPVLTQREPDRQGEQPSAHSTSERTQLPCVRVNHASPLPYDSPFFPPSLHAGTGHHVPLPRHLGSLGANLRSLLLVLCSSFSRVVSGVHGQTYPHCPCTRIATCKQLCHENMFLYCFLHPVDTFAQATFPGPSLHLLSPESSRFPPHVRGLVRHIDSVPHKSASTHHDPLFLARLNIIHVLSIALDPDRFRLINCPFTHKNPSLAKTVDSKVRFRFPLYSKTVDVVGSESIPQQRTSALRFVSRTSIATIRTSP